MVAFFGYDVWYDVISDVKNMWYFCGLRACEGYDVKNITKESYFVSKYKNSLVLCYRIINKFLFSG